MYKRQPYAWQKEQKLLHSRQHTPEETSSTFSFFRDYWTEKTERSLPDTDKNDRITLELNGRKQDPALAHCKLPELCYSIGRAADLLRGDIQQQLRNVAGELSIRHLRLRNVFSDDLFVYYETPDKVPVYNWQYIDCLLYTSSDSGSVSSGRKY